MKANGLSIFGKVLLAALAFASMAPTCSNSNSEYWDLNPAKTHAYINNRDKSFNRIQDGISRIKWDMIRLNTDGAGTYRDRETGDFGPFQYDHVKDDIWMAKTNTEGPTEIVVVKLDPQKEMSDRAAQFSPGDNIWYIYDLKR